MIHDSTHQQPVDPDRPMDIFSECHAAIRSGLAAFAGLPELAAAAERSRRVAAATVSMFDDSVLQHHADEEGDLFPAVLRSAAPGEERERVEAMVERLTAEHRMVEALWRKLKPAVKHAAGGGGAELNPDDVAALVHAYGQHASFEEREFLPLAQEILGRNGNHMAALGLSLHLRHAPQPVGYI